MPRPKDDRTGLVNYNNQGSRMTITKYINATNIEVTFDSGFVVERATMKNFNNGGILDPYFKSFCGVGYMGMKTYYNEAKKYKKPLEAWHSMLKRCYNENCRKHKWYEDCIVDEKWHNFSNFYQWFQENYYELPEGLGRVEIDKDFKDKQCRVYSPDTCLFIPQRINSCLKSRRTIDRQFPIGLTFNEKKQKYKVRVVLDGKDTVVGYYNTLEEAFQILKTTKESEIKRLAELYKPYMPKEVYEVVINYQVEITD